MQGMAPGQVVNGGLIDFQDAYHPHRGMADHYGSGFMHGGLHQQCLGAFPGQVQSFGGVQHPFPGLAGGMPSGAPAATHLPCISGPPAYLHVNGQTYVPVDAQQPVAASKPVVQAEPAAEPGPRVLTEDEIERRVRNRVEEWAAGQRKPVYYEGTGSAARRAKTTDEDRAADRIRSVNAGMRGRFVSPL